jgi:hypothetical protein
MSPGGTIGTIKPRNDLANSTTTVTFAKPLDQYEFRVLEKNSQGNCLCVVVDGLETLGLADIGAEDIAEYTPAPPNTDSMAVFTAILAAVNEANRRKEK